MRILTLHGVNSSGRTTFLCYASAALVKRDVRRRVASDPKVRILIIGRTQRSTFILRNMFLDETESLGITGRDRERGDYVLDSIPLTDITLLPVDILETDYVLADDVDWNTLYKWARLLEHKIGQLFYAGGVKSIPLMDESHVAAQSGQVHNAERMLRRSLPA